MDGRMTKGNNMKIETLFSDHKALQEQLADVQQRYDVKKREYTDACSALLNEWSKANAELLAEHDAMIDKSGEVETQLRTAVIEAYQANPSSKTVAPGLSVRINTGLKYDPAKALDWAKSHSLALALDKKAFEAIAKAQPIDFVETVETPSAVIKL